MPEIGSAQNETEQLRRWLLDANPDATEITDDTDIIDSRLLTSLQFVEFILQIEHVRGSSIDFDAIDLESVRTLKDIQKNYLAVGSSSEVSV